MSHKLHVFVEKKHPARPARSQAPIRARRYSPAS